MNETEKILNEHLRHAVLSASEEVAEEARMHHRLKPNKGKRSLRWPKPQGWATPKGNFVFAKKVNHPGTEADPFLYNALDAESAEVEKIFSRHVGFALEEIENAFGD